MVGSQRELPSSTARTASGDSDVTKYKVPGCASVCAQQPLQVGSRRLGSTAARHGHSGQWKRACFSQRKLSAVVDPVIPILMHAALFTFSTRPLDAQCTRTLHSGRWKGVVHDSMAAGWPAEITERVSLSRIMHAEHPSHPCSNGIRAEEYRPVPPMVTPSAVSLRYWRSLTVLFTFVTLELCTSQGRLFCMIGCTSITTRRLKLAWFQART